MPALALCKVEDADPQLHYGQMSPLFCEAEEAERDKPAAPLDQEGQARLVPLCKGKDAEPQEHEGQVSPLCCEADDAERAPVAALFGPANQGAPGVAEQSDLSTINACLYCQ